MKYYFVKLNSGVDYHSPNSLWNQRVLVPAAVWQGGKTANKAISLY